MKNTELMFLSHASVIIKYKEEYLLTDPWYEQPGFGSWIPIPPMYVHPSYVASLKDKLTILVSHAHDDHCDNKYLNLFDKHTPICSSDFSSSGVKKRVSKIGFSNYHDISREGKQIGSFYIRSFRNEDISLDDAMYTIRTPESLIIHCNDNWRLLQQDIKEAFIEEVNKTPKGNVVYLSQNNAASGFPTVYTNLEPDLKQEIAKDVVDKRLIEGMQNASDVGAKYFLPYAGFVGVFVKENPKLLESILVLNKKYIDKYLPEYIPTNVEVLDMLPGDIFVNHQVTKHFFSQIEDKDLIEKAIQYYNDYAVVNDCQSFTEYTSSGITLDGFLEQFNQFTIVKVDKSNFYPSVIGKTMSINVIDDPLFSRTLHFGKGLVPYETEANLVVDVSKNILTGVLEKEILFENLHVGMLATFQRYPKDVHHRDILMYITMFSYIYKG